jgi:serine/threonine-protein kinase
MRSRILFGVVAWLLGAATATAGSLLAVSLLGEGITSNSGQLLTQDAVNSELASEAAQASPFASPAVTPTVTASGAPSSTRTTATPSPVITSASPVITSASPVPTPVATTTAPPGPASPGGTVLTSSGGEVVAACQDAGAYLISWSPLQGYEVGDVFRGPAATARVTFESTTREVTMVVSCSAGQPSARSGGTM